MKKTLLLFLAACGGGGATTPDASAPREYGGDRPVELQIPTSFDPSQTYPLVMVLHGYGVNGFLQTSLLQLQNVPSDPGAFLIAPDGTIDSRGKQFWNASQDCCNLDGSDVDDVAYLGGLIDSVMADWPIDPKRVFLIGHSNGAFMSFRMACERADVVTAIAPLAGWATRLPGWTCDPSVPVSVLDLHGTDDMTIPFDGGNGLGAVGSVDEWQAHDGCATTRTAGAPKNLDRNLDGDETTVEIADGCPTGVDVELWSIVGADHVPDFTDDYGAQVVGWLMQHPRP